MRQISTDKAPAAIGPYCQAVVHGDMVFTSGQISLDPVTGEWNLAAADPLVYTHGKYFHLGDFIGKFGWSVKKQ